MKRLAGMMLLAGIAGCVEHTLTVDSEPKNALVFLNNQEIGRTPVTRHFTYYGNFDVQLRADGYETVKTQKWVVAPIWNWVPFDLVAEILPFPLRDTHTISIQMQPASTQPIDPAVLIDRAVAMRGKLESSENTRKPTTNPLAKPTTKPTTKPLAKPATRPATHSPTTSRSH